MTLKMIDLMEKFLFSFKKYAARKTKQSSSGKIVLFGAGEIGIDIFLHFKRNNIKIDYWIDTRAETMKLRILGMDIQNPAVLKSEKEKLLVIVCSIEFKEEIIEKISHIVNSPPKIVTC